MTDRPVRTRYAPSPTGDPHIGNIRTALFAWAMARSHGGQFLLRIEDTDRARLVPGSVEAIYDSLRWLGIDWDEGPDIGGPHGPYLQSERLDLYQVAAARLMADGRAYPCFCSAERLEEMRAAQIAARRPPGYDGACRAIPAATAAARAANERHVVRFAMQREGTTVLEDLIRGTVAFDNALQDDFVALKSDGFPTYHLALVVDDTDMEISHAIRGDEWISSAPKHLQLYEALGYEPTLFAHMPLILGPDHKKLSKRTGDTALLEYRRQGYLPSAMINFLALLGWSLDDHTTLIGRDDLLSHFSIERVVANPAVFDVERLNFLNGHYIRELPSAEWARIVAEACEQGLPAPARRLVDIEALADIAPLVKERVTRLSEIVPLLEFLFTEGGPDYPGSLLAERAGNDLALARSVLREALGVLTAIADHGWERDAIEAAIRSLEERVGAKLRKWISVLYVAVMGRPQGIPLFESLAILGREESLERLRVAWERLEP